MPEDPTTSRPAANDRSMEPPERDATSLISDGVACGGCGYDLVGLAPASDCPECGRDAGTPRPARMLSTSNRAYVEQVHGECARVRSVFRLALLASVAAIGLSIIAALQGGRVDLRVVMGIVGVVAGAIHVVLLLALVALVWMLRSAGPFSARAGGAGRMCLVSGAWAACMALLAYYGVAILAIALPSVLDAIALVSAGTVACLGLGMLLAGASAQARSVRRRAGEHRTEIWAAGLYALPAVAAAAVLVIATTIPGSTPLAAALALGFVALAIVAADQEIGRVQRVLRRLIAERA